MTRSCSFELIKEAILFHPKLDEQNNFETIVKDYKTGAVVKINRTGYFILKILHDGLGCSVAKIKDILARDYWIKIDVGDINSFLEKMSRYNVVYQK